MYIRKLKIEDAPLMLSWMHDQCVVKDLHGDFLSKSLEDCERFIQWSLDGQNNNLHYAIASDNDEYMGTVSLKHIQNGNAEFAIAVRSVAMAKGYAWFGMQEILKIAFDQLKLSCVYWCVSRNNQRAIRFYDKHHFKETIDVPEEIHKKYSDLYNLKWYSILAGDELETRGSVVGCKIVHIKTIPTVNSGELSFFEGTCDVPFEIKRIYYISKVPEGIRRGFHAHKELKQLLFCPYGRIQLVLENEYGKEEIELSDPSIGVLVDRPTWREMLWLRTNSVLCVAASDYYKSEDYIRNHDEFLRYIRASASGS